MAKRTDLSSILVIGSGPIVIGQACEFDYSGTQACRVLRQEGYRVILVNSNPATIMTDPEFADRTYLEPLTPESVLAVIERERPDALLPTIGGQTGLNVSVALAESGDLDRLGVELIGASLETIHRAEDRSGFKETMTKAGLDVPRAGIAHTLDEALQLGAQLGFPVIVRPSFTLGGGGSGFASSPAELAALARRSLDASPVSEVLVEESIAGWKEFELEVMRDHADNAVVVCSIENVDPMGVHTGDSVTVAPQQTLTDREYQAMRDDALACLRAIGVETGGSNVQFAVDPDTGRRVLIEMNPRVSRSSALASKATGFPIAKIAAMLAVGYRLDEIRNDITGATPASFEPTLDYVVVKIPRFAFEKFPDADAGLTSTMKSVGEVMAIGRTFREAFGKAWRGLEKAGADLGAAYVPPADGVLDALRARHRGSLPSDRAGVRRGSQRGRGRRGVRDRSLVRRPVRAGLGARRRARGDVALGARRGSASGAPSAPVCRTRGSRGHRSRPSARSASGGRRSTSSRSSSPSTPAAVSSPLERRTTTPPTTRSRRWSPRRGRAS